MLINTMKVRKINYDENSEIKLEVKKVMWMEM